MDDWWKDTTIRGRSREPDGSRSFNRRSSWLLELDRLVELFKGKPRKHATKSWKPESAVVCLSGCAAAQVGRLPTGVFFFWFITVFPITRGSGFARCGKKMLRALADRRFLWLLYRTVERACFKGTSKSEERLFVWL
jgi:hypothetical protein